MESSSVLLTPKLIITHLNQYVYGPQRAKQDLAVADYNHYLRQVEELAARKATINEFYLACVYSNTDNLQAKLYYLGCCRLKVQEEKS